MEVLVEEGMHVKEGQILARIDDTNVKAELKIGGAHDVRTRCLAETKARIRKLISICAAFASCEEQHLRAGRSRPRRSRLPPHSTQGSLSKKPKLSLPSELWPPGTTIGRYGGFARRIPDVTTKMRKLAK